MNEFRGISPMIMTGNLAESWKLWRQKFENYLVASEVKKKDESIQVAQLLHYIGEEGFAIYNTFTFQEGDKKLTEVLKRFEEYFLPKKNLSYERFKFFTRRQITGESIEQFVTDLKNKAQNCEFGELKNGLVKDLLTCGLQDISLREKLLQKDALSLDDAVKLCISVEKTREQSSQMSVINNNVVSVPVEAIHKAYNKQSGSDNRARRNQVLRDRSSFNTGNRQVNAAVTGKQSGNLQRQKQGRNFSCYRCGKSHLKSNCPAYGKKCGRCGLLNHFAKMCQNKNIHTVCTNNSESSQQENGFLLVDSILDEYLSDSKSWNVSLLVNDRVFIDFKLDTGAMANCLSINDFSKLKISIKNLTKCNVKLTSYSNNRLPVLGKFNLKCQYKNKTCLLQFYVINSNTRSLLGLEGCKALNLVQKVDSIDRSIKVNNFAEYSNILEPYKTLFSGLGCISGKCHIQLKENCTPVINPPRKVPLPLLSQLKNALIDLEKNKIIRKVDEPTDWVNSLVIVKKSDNTLRLCLDPTHLNKAIKREHFALPTIEEITSKLGGSAWFSILDANSGFWQICLDDESAKLCTFSTPFGRFCFLRMPYGISLAPEFFHKRFRNIFNIEGVELYIDDILVYGRTKVEHDKRLLEVLKVAQKNNVTFNKSKCKFGLKEVHFMGHKLTKDGIMPDDRKINSIKSMEIPKDKTELQRFLGMVNYIGRFVPNLSNLNSPLRKLLKKDVVFSWDENHTNYFNELKRMLTKQPILQYFDVNKPTVISVDASKNGLGCVLLQSNLPCAYASKALSDSQLNWAQIEKELAAVLFGCERFSQYVYGKKFVVETDHKPLIYILKKPLASCPGRLQKMLLQLQKFDFDLVYKRGKDLFIADALSRAVHKDSSDNDFDFDMDSQICVIDLSIDFTDKKLKEYQDATVNDENLSMLNNFVKNGWPKSIKKVPVEVKPYFKFRHEIVEFNGLLFKGDKLIVPKSKRAEIISKIHYSHFGIVKCKNRAAESFYWPAMATQIEDVISHCKICIVHQNSKQREPLINHEIPYKPWNKIGCDILYMGRVMYLLVIDYYTKWVELVMLSSNAHSQTVIQHLKSMFARLGIPSIMISDGGPQFNSLQFKKFADEWGFKHIFTSPRNPQSNGQVERAKQTVKKLISKANEDGKDLELALLNYRNTPIDHLKYTPAELLMSRKLRDLLPVVSEKLTPHFVNYKKYNQNLKFNQRKQAFYYNRNKKTLRQLSSGQKIRFQKTPNSKWSFGRIVDRTRPRSYRVETKNGNEYIRNRKFIGIVPDDVPQVVYNEKQVSPRVSPKNKIKPEDSSTLDDSLYDCNPDNDRDSMYVNFNDTSLNRNLSELDSQLPCTSKGRIVKPPDRLQYN